MTSGDKVRASGTFTLLVAQFFITVLYLHHLRILVRGTFPKWMLYLGTSASLLAMVKLG